MTELNTGIKNEKQEKSLEGFLAQEGELKKISKRIWDKFESFRRDRDNTYAYFGWKNLVSYVSESNALFNNFRLKPDWKDVWQANISDPTTHSKLMAIAAQLILSREQPQYKPRFEFDFYAKVKANMMKNIYDWTETQGIYDGARDGVLDDLFAIIRAMRDGTVVAFEGFRDTEAHTGIDFQFLPIEDFFPGNMMKFRMEDQLDCVWRGVLLEKDFKEKFSKGPWIDIDKVQGMGALAAENLSYFNISADISQDEIEVLRYFNRVDNEFYVRANGVVITKPDSKLTSIMPVDRDEKPKIPFIKTVFEPYDDKFFPGRSFPNIQKDTQDAIDFLFNNMFDKEILSVMRPILTGQNNDLTEDYWYPGGTAAVLDVEQIKELGFEGPDLGAFRILKELKDRQNLAIDPSQQGISVGQRTATEVTEAAESANKIFGLSNIFISDFRMQKARLRNDTIKHKLIKHKKFASFVIESTRLLNNDEGKRIINIVQQVSARDEFGFSPALLMKNATIDEKSEIIEIGVGLFKNFKIDVKMEMFPETRFSKRFKKERFLSVALQRSDIYDQPTVGDMFAEMNDVDPDRVRVKQQQGMEELLGQEAQGGEALPGFSPDASPAQQLTQQQVKQ